MPTLVISMHVIPKVREVEKKVGRYSHRLRHNVINPHAERNEKGGGKLTRRYRRPVRCVDFCSGYASFGKTNAALHHESCPVLVSWNVPPIFGLKRQPKQEVTACACVLRQGPY